MSDNPKTIQRLYQQLLRLYPQPFRERFGESMQQTFDDLYHERKRRIRPSLFSFVVWAFVETGIAIVREQLVCISSGGFMQTMLKISGVSALGSLLFIVPFMIMEIVNRHEFNEGFPAMLFFILWLNLFAINLILLPIGQSKWAGGRDAAHSLSAPEGTLLTKPKPAALISLTLILLILFLNILTSLGWEPLDRLINGPNPEQFYLPGVFISLILIAIPIAAGVIAARPIVSNLRSGSSLFAHPLLLIIVVTISFFFLTGVVSLLIDQWPCFIGVPHCD